MDPDFQNFMREATRLTRQGDLQSATAILQQALGARGASGPGAQGDVIDVEAREVPDDEALALEGLPPSVDDAPPGFAQAESRAAAPAPTPEAFIAGRHGGAGLAGRDYKLYVPPGPATAPRPLLVMLHGCTQHPDDFAAGTRMNEAARAQGFFVLYPAQAQRANPQRCWNWFKPSHQQRGRGEAALIAGMTREVMARYGVDASRVYVAGLSAGGAMAANLGAAYPELFAAVGVHSGLAPGAARDLPSALDAMKKGGAGLPELPVPAIVFHGDADATVHPLNAEQVARAAASGAQAQAETVRAPGRRDAVRRVYRDASGQVRAEHWHVRGGPHAWSGGSAQGSHTDPSGPDATAEMLRFFREHPRG